MDFRQRLGKGGPTWITHHCWWVHLQFGEDSRLSSRFQSPKKGKSSHIIGQVSMRSSVQAPKVCQKSESANASDGYLLYTCWQPCLGAILKGRVDQRRGYWEKDCWLNRSKCYLYKCEQTIEIGYPSIYMRPRITNIVNYDTKAFYWRN